MGQVHAFLYKKVVYKKVFIKLLKIKKVLIYNPPEPKKFHKKSPVRKSYIYFTGPPINQSDGMGMKVPCLLTFYGQNRFVDLLRSHLRILLPFS